MFASPIKCVFELSKEWKSKTINARRKIKTVLESVLNSAQSYRTRLIDFKFSGLIFFLQVIGPKKKIYCLKYQKCCLKIIHHKKKLDKN